MIIEIVITGIIIIAAIFIFYRSITKKARGGCDCCDGCASKCGKEKIKNNK